MQETSSRHLWYSLVFTLTINVHWHATYVQDDARRVSQSHEHKEWDSRIHDTVKWNYSYKLWIWLWVSNVLHVARVMCNVKCVRRRVRLKNLHVGVRFLETALRREVRFKTDCVVIFWTKAFFFKVPQDYFSLFRINEIAHAHIYIYIWECP